MKKYFRRMGCIALMVSIVLGGCGVKQPEDVAAKTEGGVVNIYCWNTEFKGIYEQYAADLAESHGVEVNFVVITNDYSAYQTNLDEMLAEQEQVIDDDKVDIFLIEADYASKYIKSDATLDVIKDIGLTEEDLSQQYQYTKDIVTEEGALKGVSWQATPGLFAYRRSIAKQVLGTDDPDQVQEKLKNWDSFDQVAKQMYDSGYKMLSGYDDSFRTFSNNMSQPWVENNKIRIDDSMKRWVDQTKTYTEKNYNNQTSLWSPGWSADQGPDGKVFGFFYSTWGINFTLMGNSLADSNAEAKVGNGIYGDYAVCEGPQPYYWGGTWICAARGTDNVPFIKDLMYRLTCDEQTMKQITTDTLDYTNNQTAMNEIANSDYSSDFLGGQNHIALFAEAATKIDMSNVSPYDSGLNEKFQNAMHEYFEGKVDYDTALDNFYRMASERYPELTN
ncbi:MAG: ABC transporter substrate-binding protein [Lachnospiraceae bacterium]|nr:ABC transporter substrate-binding protein [bacterium]MDY5516423.1 ABC transporter substrate-binding protein [Lachnospiraceae bacterium]